MLMVNSETKQYEKKTNNEENWKRAIKCKQTKNHSVIINTDSILIKFQCAVWKLPKRHDEKVNYKHDKLK